MRLSTILRIGKKNNLGIPSTEAVAGDVCMYGISEGKLIIVNDWDASKYPIDKYPPIGIVVVPGSHGHYADGKCAVMSLNHMDSNTPTTGGNYSPMYWGNISVNISSLPWLDGMLYVGWYNSIGNNTVLGIDDGSYLPSDSFTGLDNPYDNKTKYSVDGGNRTYYFGPSPYQNDETFNPNYSMIDSPSSTNNSLADFDGKGNTQKIIEVRGSKDYSSWKPTYNNQNDYPAASCCDMYFTQGTKQGDWYLPAVGELGYVIARKKAIENSIKKLIEGGVSSAQYFDTQQFYWSSSQASTTYAWQLILKAGLFSYYHSKNSAYRVRAFTLV